jgi:hypothetical protein
MWAVILLCVVGMFVFLLPAIIAKRRNCEHYLAIGLLSFVAWPVALVWAMVGRVGYRR